MVDNFKLSSSVLLERLKDLERPLRMAPSPPSRRRATCQTDLKKCVDFSFKASEGELYSRATFLLPKAVLRPLCVMISQSAPSYP